MITIKRLSVRNKGDVGVLIDIEGKENYCDNRIYSVGSGDDRIRSKEK